MIRLVDIFLSLSNIHIETKTTKESSLKRVWQCESVMSAYDLLDVVSYKIGLLNLSKLAS